MKRIDEIEILRAIAISMVLLAHSTMLTGWPWKVLSLGTGVDLFLAISGFVITKSLVGSSAIPFWIRRAYRILPAAWLWLAVGLLATAYFNSFGSFGSLTDNVNDAIASLLQIQNVHYGRCIEATGRTCANGGVPFGIYWSLSLEEQFYLVLPFLFMLPRRLMCGGMLIAIALQLFTVRSAMAAQLRTDALLLGVLMGLWSLHPSYERFRPTFLRHPLIATAAVGSLIAALCLASKISSIPVGMAALISAALVFIASYGAGYIPAPVKPVLTLDRKPLVFALPMSLYRLWCGQRDISLDERAPR